MNNEQYLLVKLAEEASEIAQIALKSVQYGLSERKEGQDLTNAQRLNSELSDLFIILTFMQASDCFALEREPDEITLAKKAKVEKYWDLAIKLGKVNG